MLKIRSKISLTVVSMVTGLILLLSSTTLNGYSQGLEIPEFKSKKTFASQPSEEIAMKVLLEEHEFLDDYYDVDDFAFVASNTSQLCPSSDCEYELDDGRMGSAYTAGERDLTGKFKVDTGETTKVMNMRTDWETIEERQTTDGEIVQVIEGELGIGRDEFSPENKYQINGTLTTDDDDYILEVKGMK